MKPIVVRSLSKTYKQFRKGFGLKGSLSSLVKRRYYDVEAVRGISFEVGEGEIVGLIGPNGAGKTTTLKCLAGILHPTSGNVNILGYTPWERNRDLLRRISLVMGQKSQLWWDLPAMDSFLISKEIYQIPDQIFQRNVERLIDMLELSAFLDVQVRRLSLGQRMRCELAFALLHDPEVVYLDEPTIGLDLVMQKRLRDFLKENQKERGHSIILTSHYMEDVNQLADRVLIVNHGLLIFNGSIKELVDKYQKERIISVKFAKKIEAKDLREYGTILEYDDNLSEIEVPTENTTKIVSHLIRNFPVKDLEIKDLPLEEIIRRLYAE